MSVFEVNVTFTFDAKLEVDADSAGMAFVTVQDCFHCSRPVYDFGSPRFLPDSNGSVKPSAKVIGVPVEITKTTQEILDSINNLYDDHFGKEIMDRIRARNEEARKNIRNVAGE